MVAIKDSKSLHTPPLKKPQIKKYLPRHVQFDDAKLSHASTTLKRSTAQAEGVVVLGLINSITAFVLPRRQKYACVSFQRSGYNHTHTER